MRGELQLLELLKQAMRSNDTATAYQNRVRMMRGEVPRMKGERESVLMDGKRGLGSSGR